MNRIQNPGAPPPYVNKITMFPPLPQLGRVDVHWKLENSYLDIHNHEQRSRPSTSTVMIFRTIDIGKTSRIS